MEENFIKCEPLTPTAADGKIITVGMADIKIAEGPKILQTTLGSCVAVCAYSRPRKTGGLLHFMMPGILTGIETQHSLKEAKYAATGIPKLFNLLMQRGIHPDGLEVKVFGGARILKSVTRDIGSENRAAADLLLSGRGLNILPGRTGGTCGFRLEFDLETGLVKCRAIDEKTAEEY